MKNSTPVNIPTTTACTAKNLSGKTPLFRATAKRFARVVFSALSLGLLATACKQDPVTPPTPQQLNSTPVEFSLTALPLVSSSAAQIPTGSTESSLAQSLTRSVAPLTTTQEQRVNNLWVIQFEKTTGLRVGSPVYVDVPEAWQIDDEVRFSADLTSILTTQVLYFIANTNDIALLSGSNAPTDIAALNQKFLAIAPELKPTATTGLPMLAIKEVANVQSGTPIKGILLERLVSRINFRYKVNTVKLPTLTVTNVRLRNVPKGSYFEAQPTGSVNYPAKATGSHIDYPFETLASLTIDGDGYTTATWYLPENLRKAATGLPVDFAANNRSLTNTDDQMVTYVEILAIADGQFFAYSFLLGDISNSASDFDVRRNTIYNITADIIGKSTNDERVTEPLINVAPNQTANSYMIRPGATISFPAKIKGNEATETLATQSIGLLWQDVSGLVKSTTYDSGTGKATVITAETVGVAGNAVVAAYSGAGGTGTILWSWHIWITSYKPSEAGIAARATNTAYIVPGGQVHTYGTAFQATNSTSRTIMDRDLGAKRTYTSASPATLTAAEGTYGCLYQWGRKDPFPPSQITTATSIPTYNAAGTQIAAILAPILVNGRTTTANAILKPTSFFYNTTLGDPQDWLLTPDANLWKSTVKTINDPCPKGWRVAPSGTWSDFTRTDATTGNFLWYNDGILNTSTETAGAQNGRRYSVGTVSAWYPTCGSRSAISGAIESLGIMHTQSSSDVAGVAAKGFASHQNYITVEHSGLARAQGLSIRCVQE